MAGKVLIVDDDLELRSGMAEVLFFEGFEVRAVSDGSSAIEVMDSGFAPDAVLLDYMMPKMDGAACYEILRERWPSVPVLMLTAAGTIPKVEGLWGALHKPCHPDRLVDTVKRMVAVAKRPRG